MKALYTILIVTLFYSINIRVYGQAALLPLSGGELVEHEYYTLRYSEWHEQPVWVAYTLTNEMVNGNAKRADNFRSDPEVDTESASLKDYEASGYDRGHLCPAADMNFSSIAMSESFFMSNMSPQSPQFNRGIWKKFEAVVRNWANTLGEIYVVTGPVFRDNIGKIGPNDVTIPGYYYKVIYDAETQKMIAAVLPNKKGEKPLQSYVCTVDSVELITGIDFFAAMDDEIEAGLESQKNIAEWSFKPFSSSAKKTVVKDSGKEQATHQCEAITSSGKRCSRKAEPGSRFCWQHQKK